MKVLKPLAGFAGIVVIALIGYVFVAAIDMLARLNGIYAHNDYPHLLRFVVIATGSVVYWTVISCYETLLRWAGFRG